MKKILFVIAAFLAVTVLKAQNCTMYFPVKEGSVAEITSYDKKDKPTGTNSIKIIKKEASANTVSVTAESEFKDVKGKNSFKSNVEVKCVNGEFHVNMNNYFDQAMLAGYSGMDIKVESTQMKIPASFNNNQKLDDGGVTVTVTQNGFKLMNMTVKITNRQIVGTEKITTPAGTFDCVKITYDVESKMIFTVKAKGVEYLAKEVGVIRSESRDENGKLLSYNVLTSLK